MKTVTRYVVRMKFVDKIVWWTSVGWVDDIRYAERTSQTKAKSLVRRLPDQFSPTIITETLQRP